MNTKNITNHPPVESLFCMKYVVDSSIDCRMMSSLIARVNHERSVINEHWPDLSRSIWHGRASGTYVLTLGEIWVKITNATTESGYSGSQSHRFRVPCPAQSSVHLGDGACPGLQFGVTIKITIGTGVGSVPWVITFVVTRDMNHGAIPVPGRKQLVCTGTHVRRGIHGEDLPEVNPLPPRTVHTGTALTRMLFPFEVQISASEVHRDHMEITGRMNWR